MGNVKITSGPNLDPVVIHPQNTQQTQHTTNTFLTTNQTNSSIKQNQQSPDYLLHNPEELRRKVEDIVDKLNKTALIFDRSLKFQIHDKTNTPMVSVIDTTSNKIIREIPPKEILDIFAKMQDYLGLIFDKRA